MKKLVHTLLSYPAVFELQQRLCNNYGAIRRHFANYLEVRDKDILDIGCAVGSCAKVVIPMQENRYTGIDIEPQYIARAVERCPDGKFQTMDARKMTFADDSFDVVMFVGVLHHMDDTLIRDCFRETRRVLRPSGVVLCVEPVFTPGKPLSNFLLRKDRGGFIRDEPGYRRLFTGFHVDRQDFFRVSVHRCCSFVLKKEAALQGCSKGSFSACSGVGR